MTKIRSYSALDNSGTRSPIKQKTTSQADLDTVVENYISEEVSRSQINHENRGIDSFKKSKEEFVMEFYNPKLRNCDRGITNPFKVEIEMSCTFFLCSLTR